MLLTNRQNRYESINRMDKRFLLFVLSILFITPVQAQWTSLDSGTSISLYAVDFPVDENVGYAVGTTGTILKTSDAGASWSKKKSRVRDLLTDVDFIDNNVGYATGANGIILKTSDAGASWTSLISGTSNHLYAVHFPANADVGYVGGASNTLLKTLDGGQTWLPLIGIEGWVQDIVFPNNSSIGYASTIYGTLGYIYKTTDGGANWTRVLYLEDASLYSMSFPADDQVGYVANHDNYTQHGVWKTSDGGANWNLVTSGLTSVPVAVDFSADTQNGLAVGYYGAVLKTTNGGATWSEGGLGVSSRMEDIQLITTQVAYAVGQSGTIFKTTDGGGAPIESLYLHPSASGSVNSFTDMVGCSSDWDCVNDQAGNLGTGLPETVNSQNYVADGSGHRAMFALDDGAVTANQTVTEICVSIAATQSSGPYASISYQRLGIDPSPVDTTPFWIGSYWYNGIKTHCWSNLSWTASDLDALEIGVKTRDGHWLQLAQLYVKVFYSAAP